MKTINIIGHIFMSIPMLLILISGAVSYYAYTTQIYPLTIATPITFFSIVGLWIFGLIFTRIGNSKNELKGGIEE